MAAGCGEEREDPLVVRKLIEKEGVEASDEDLQKEIEIQAERNNMSVQELSEYYERNQMKEYLKHELQERKLYDMLLEQAKVKKGKEIHVSGLGAGKCVRLVCTTWRSCKNHSTHEKEGAHENLQSKPCPDRGRTDRHR